MSSSSFHPYTTLWIVQSRPTYRALGMTNTPQKIAFQLGQCVFKANTCERDRQAPTSRSCKNISTQFPPWCLAIHCTRYQYHQTYSTCCACFGLVSTTNVMRWARSGGTHWRLPHHRVWGRQFYMHGSPSTKPSCGVG